MAYGAYSPATYNFKINNNEAGRFNFNNNNYLILACYFHIKVKNNIIMKHSISLSAAVIAASMLITSCNNSSKDSTVTTTDTTTTNTMADTSSMNTTPSTTAMATPEQEFINYAVPGNTNEIDWLNAGVKYGNKDVKEHAGMMLKDHMALDKKVGAYLATHTNLTAPTVDTTNAITINDKMGNDWNKEIGRAHV